jgi:hypothetical protein
MSQSLNKGHVELDQAFLGACVLLIAIRAEKPACSRVPVVASLACRSAHPGGDGGVGTYPNRLGVIAGRVKRALQPLTRELKTAANRSRRFVGRSFARNEVGNPCPYRLAAAPRSLRSTRSVPSLSAIARTASS